jgi:Heterokaryon incompatibility protein (HET)
MADAKSVYNTQLNADRNEIRTLSLLPGQPEELIRCHLETVSLSDKNPKFTALSYVWGNALQTRPIDVDGNVFQATANLVSALQHIRKADVTEVLWVDAVCINQQDVTERNQQVRLMRTIYSTADSVLIWLGEGDKHSEDLFDVISKDGVPSPPDRNGDVDNDRLREQFTIEICRIYALFSTIAIRPWWARVWIVQECLLPEKPPIIQCGGKTVLWSDFFAALWKTGKGARHTVPNAKDHPSIIDIYDSAGINRTLFSGGMPYLELLDIMRMEYAEKKRPYSFSMIITALEGRKATVPHDYVFGYLGLVSEENRKLIAVHYERPSWEVYRDLTRELLRSRDDESQSAFSSLSFQSSRDAPDRPTWVPDFSSQVHHNDQAKRYTGWFLAFEDCWRSLEPRFSGDGNILLLGGAHLDVIREVYPFGEDRDGFTEVLDEMEELAWDIIESQQQKLEDQSIDPLFKTSCSSLRRLFSANSRPDLDLAGVTSEQLDFWWDVFQTPDHERWDDLVAPENTKIREELAGHSTSELIMSMLRQAEQTCFGRSLITTERESLLGICVPGVRAGDLLVCLFGMNMPWILRPAQGNDYYTVVGGVFIHGLTDWSILDECCAKGRVAEAIFRIR